MRRLDQWAMNVSCLCHATEHSLHQSLVTLLRSTAEHIKRIMSVGNNFKTPGTGMDVWGKQRLELGVLLRDKVLNELNIPWVVENGTLLGAYRSGKFIPHDDDFDIALFFESNPSDIVPDILNKLKQLLPEPYEARYVSNYAQKIEVYDPTYGSFNLCGPQYNGADFYYVCADLQFYQRFDNIYRCLYFIQANVVEIPVQTLFPLRSISLESQTFQAPNNVENYLKCQYGSISPTAKFNPSTGLYEDLI
ncbi:uncharacterized protein LOC114515679 [Dendronephthya gigantea]|uniref:uncharacterized protein LOC114515679 n=1 Tax=Dendronephthya gigantea TaxID=151771 RepID=UPI00106C4C51|nr:uncharacterized protein LOC114515679 [Dendronephthya gigantea]